MRQSTRRSLTRRKPPPSAPGCGSNPPPGAGAFRRRPRDNRSPRASRPRSPRDGSASRSRRTPPAGDDPRSRGRLRGHARRSPAMRAGGPARLAPDRPPPPSGGSSTGDHPVLQVRREVAGGVQVGPVPPLLVGVDPGQELVEAGLRPCRPRGRRRRALRAQPRVPGDPSRTGSGEDRWGPLPPGAVERGERPIGGLVRGEDRSRRMEVDTVVGDQRSPCGDRSIPTRPVGGHLPVVVDRLDSQVRRDPGHHFGRIPPLHPEAPSELRQLRVEGGEVIVQQPEAAGADPVGQARIEHEEGTHPVGCGARRPGRIVAETQVTAEPDQAGAHRAGLGGPGKKALVRRT